MQFVLFTRRRRIPDEAERNLAKCGRATSILFPVDHNWSADINPYGKLEVAFLSRKEDPMPRPETTPKNTR